MTKKLFPLPIAKYMGGKYKNEKLQGAQISYYKGEIIKSTHFKMGTEETVSEPATPSKRKLFPKNQKKLDEPL